MKLITKIKEIWNEYGFEILVCVSLLFIFVVYLFRRGKKGTWNTTYFFPKEALLNSNKNYNRSSEYFSNNPPNNFKKESKGEIECKKVLEELFGKRFYKTRPDFLKNPIGNYNLELDCFNPELKIAVEYNGIQHYKYTPYFHKSRDSFQNQQYRDYIKREACSKNGIFLIEVPYTVKLEEIKPFILDKLSLYKWKN